MKSLTDTVVVENVESDATGGNNLEKWCDTNTFCLAIFVLPTPECTTASSSYCLWCFVTTTQPGSNFAKFQLGEWSIG